MMRWLLFSLLWGLSVATSAAGLTDLLDLPAEPDERSLRSLLLDVTAAGDRLVAVGEYGTVLYSDDGGKGWRQAHVVFGDHVDPDVGAFSDSRKRLGCGPRCGDPALRRWR